MNFNKTTDLPSTVDTVEKLFVWTASLLGEVLPEELIKLTGSTNPITRLDYGISQDFEQKSNYAASFYIPLSDDWRSSGNKIWEEAEELSELAIPAAYKS